MKKVYILEDLDTLVKELHANIPQLSYIGVDDIKNYRFNRIYESLRDAAIKAYKEHEEEIEKIFQECLREWLEECINKFVDIKDMRLKN